ncbi:MAG TPA: hypothetical protein VNR51_05540 [Hyphomicrobium sp.]|nr:hypothetical protein [Hyphomicrobium sp.]
MAADLERCVEGVQLRQSIGRHEDVRGASGRAVARYADAVSEPDEHKVGDT